MDGPAQVMPPHGLHHRVTVRSRGEAGAYPRHHRRVGDACAQVPLGQDGIHHRVWLNEGELNVGEDIMYVPIGGDIRPHVVEGPEYLVGCIKNECVVEKELVHKKGP